MPGDKPWTAACAAGADRFVAYGSSSELRVQHYADGPNAQQLTAQHIELGAPLDPDDSGGDRLRFLCEDGHAQLLFIAKDLSLQELACDKSTCTPARALTKNVAEFDAVRRRGLTLIAYQQGPVAPTIKLLRLDEQGKLAGNPSIVGTCWEPLGGMCGRPIFDLRRTTHSAAHARRSGSAWRSRPPTTAAPLRRCQASPAPARSIPAHSRRCSSTASARAWKT